MLRGCWVARVQRRNYGLKLNSFSSEAKLRFETKFFFTRNRDKVPPELQRALEKVAWYVLIPEKMYFIDNSVAFGHREEVSLPQFE